MALVPASSRGGALPSQWTVDSGGGLDINPGNSAGVVLTIERNDALASDLVQINQHGGGFALEMTNKGRSIFSSSDTTADQFAIVPLATPAANVPMVSAYAVVGTNAFYLSRNCYLVIDARTAPADAELSANQCALWYDPTNGASKLMVKAKQADGTVKTASVALA